MFSDAIILGEKSKYGKRFYIYIEEITPNRVVKNKNAYEITHLSPFLKINGFAVTVNPKGLVENIFLFGLHPNCELKTNLYCLAKHHKGVQFNEEYYENFKNNLRVYYLDDCHYIPTGGHLQYEKMKSVYMQFNK
jgi:hypothetical protein